MEEAEGRKGKERERERKTHEGTQQRSCARVGFKMIRKKKEGKEITNNDKQLEARRREKQWRELQEGAGVELHRKKKNGKT